MTWTKEIPTQDGYYWFFGYVFGKERDSDKPKLEMVEVRFSLLIAHNTFLSSNDIKGIFFPVVLPPIDTNMYEQLHLAGIYKDFLEFERRVKGL